MAPRPKHLCGCGCSLYVSWTVEFGHLNGRRSALLAANTLLWYQLLLRSWKQASKLQLNLSSRHSRKRELISHPGTAHEEAGPSGVSSHTIDLDVTLSAQHSPTPEIQDLPPPRSSPMLLLPNADGHDQYGLSMQC